MERNVTPSSATSSARDTSTGAISRRNISVVGFRRADDRAAARSTATVFTLIPPATDAVDPPMNIRPANTNWVKSRVALQSRAANPAVRPLTPWKIAEPTTPWPEWSHSTPFHSANRNASALNP